MQVTLCLLLGALGALLGPAQPLAQPPAQPSAQPLALLVDVASAPALQRAREVAAQPQNATLVLFGTFHASAVSELQELRGWAALQEAVRRLPAPHAHPGPLGPLDAVLGAAAVLPRGARILVLAGSPAVGEDSEHGTVARAAEGLRAGGITVDAWGAAACERHAVLRQVTAATGGHLCCQEAGREPGPGQRRRGAPDQPRQPKQPPGDGGEAYGGAGVLELGVNASREITIRRQAAQGDAEILSGKAVRESTGYIQDRAGAPVARTDGVLLLQPAVMIEVTRQSQLAVQAGQTVTLGFELTSNRVVPLRFLFRLKDERAWLRNLSPPEALVLPNQPMQIQATLFVPQNTPDGQFDRVTLMATSPYEQTTKSLLLSVGQQYINDNYNPTVSYSWKHRCIGAWDQSNCNTNTWTIEFSAQDRDSGILSITTIPKGVQFREDFTSGTRETVRAFYSASCCSKRVDLIVTDLRGNVFRDTYDEGSQFLDVGERASVGLAVVCILLIIAVIIMAVCLCRKRDSLTLERHLGSRR